MTWRQSVATSLAGLLLAACAAACVVGTFTSARRVQVSEWRLTVRRDNDRCYFAASPRFPATLRCYAPTATAVTP
jgi:hypothetical protein